MNNGHVRIGCLLSVLAITWGISASAEECDVVVEGEDASLSINETCMLDQGRPPIFVAQSEGGGYELLMPIPEDGTWETLWLATQSWLSNSSNLNLVHNKLSSAAAVAPWAIENEDISEVEFINQVMGNWLINGGPADEIADLTDAAQSIIPRPRCWDIPVCTSCKNYICGWIGPWYICDCKYIGVSCCVINMQTL